MDNPVSEFLARLMADSLISTKNRRLHMFGNTALEKKKSMGNGSHIKPYLYFFTSAVRFLDCFVFLDICLTCDLTQREFVKECPPLFQIERVICVLLCRCCPCSGKLPYGF